MEEIVHIIPLGIEFDRAVIPFQGREGFRPNRVYLLTIQSAGYAPSDMTEEHMEKAEKVKDFLKPLNIEVIVIDTKLIDLLDVMSKISNLIYKEKAQGNNVYINMSSAGRLTSVGATLAGMFHDVKVYYVKADRYSKTDLDREEHGITICDNRDVVFIENFKILMPNELGLKVLVEIYNKGKMKTIDIIQFLSRSNVEGFNVDYFKVRRSEKTSIIMRLNRNILDKLENAGYIKKSKLGRENEYELTESGRYVTSISGLISINPEEKCGEN